jgi:uncharacterized membrane protein (UPF0136 family)
MFWIGQRTRLAYLVMAFPAVRTFRKACFGVTSKPTHETRVGSGTAGRDACAAGQREGVALPIRLMLGAAKIYFIIFGILTIAGGVVGYVKAGSVISIIAGSISGILLLAAAWLTPDHQAAGLIVALVVSVLLAGQFVPKYFSTHKVMPAGLMSVLSVLGIVVAIAAWLRK